MNKLEKSEHIIDLIINLTDEGKLKWVEKDGDNKEESYYCDINLLTGEVYHLIFIRDYYDLDITYEYPEMSSDTDTPRIQFYFSELPTLGERLRKLGDTITLNQQQEAFDDLYTDLITVLSSVE
jgi:hypothetical protein